MSRTHCLGRPYCTGDCTSNALPRAARNHALTRLPETPGGRVLVFRPQYHSVIHRARLRGANPHEHGRLTAHTGVIVMPLARGGIARGKPFPGDLSECAQMLGVIYRAAVQACTSKPYPAGVFVMPLVRGRIARGKPFPGDLCVCISGSHISQSQHATPNLTLLANKSLRVSLPNRPRTREWSRVKRLQFIL